MRPPQSSSTMSSSFRKSERDEDYDSYYDEDDSQWYGDDDGQSKMSSFRSQGSSFRSRQPESQRSMQSEQPQSYRSTQPKSFSSKGYRSTRSNFVPKSTRSNARSTGGRSYPPPRSTRSTRSSADESQMVPYSERSMGTEMVPAASQRDSVYVDVSHINTDGEGVPPEYQNADPTKWKLTEVQFDGRFEADKFGRQQIITGRSIKVAIEHFRSNPGRYIAMTYQTDVYDWPVKRHKFTFIHREGTKRLKPKGVHEDGWMTLMIYDYQRLPPMRDNILPMKYRDQYTDDMTHNGQLLHSQWNKPILPGRGMRIGDTPNLKIIGDVDPTDINQGSVGDCWLLSAISSLAEFDGAIKHLFRKTRRLEERPLDGPNMYTITLWDLETWEEVDIDVDERLPAMADGSGKLLSAKPSIDGELWVCYLEKALAIHCGGWDAITGGICTHAWALMTGCIEQYTICINEDTGFYGCYARFNPKKKEWSQHSNCYHDSSREMWKVAWPKVGGGGKAKRDCDEEQLFQKMCAWDNEDYIIGAAVMNQDAGKDDGLVSDHAYSVIECINDVAGTDIDLIKVRNPWGKGEIEDGYFDDDGPGWDEYPEIKAELNPEVADDGMFWVTKQEFFDFFGTIYLCACSMTQFKED